MKITVSSWKIPVVALAVLAAPFLAPATAKETLTARIDAILDESYPADEPGAAVIVIDDGEKVYRGARGMAEMELGVLLAQTTGQPQFEIFPRPPTEFFYKAVDAQITFVTGADGRVTELVLHQGGAEMHAERLD